ncbi:MAG: HAMP domain-containing histidine kinase [Pseudomonadota bacterium]|nr:HAMP domain-containing histidine kinase [Pseudomonadota bacterium]
MPSFIIQNLEEILVEWESFARTVSPAASTMDSLALLDHAKQMLEAIAQDITTSQTDKQQAQKSKGLGPIFHGAATAAASHGILRHAVGFDLQQLVAEFRALRATVLRLWIAKESYGDPESAYEMARFNEAVDQALAESVESYSKELSKSRDTFLGILGHDLRSPLSALANALHLLSQPRTDPTIAAEAIEVGRRSVAAMAAMIGDLLEYTRTRLGRGIPVAPTSANLETVCKEAISEIAVVYPQTAFRFESGGTLDGTFDSARIRQLVSNLLNNAVHHGKRGAPVSMIARGEGDTLRVQVSNQGVPLSPEVLQVIFDPLVQIPAVASDPKHPSTNLGLGLFIAREIAIAHGGTIAAESSSGAGTTFSVKLPRRNQSPAVSAPGAEALV